MNNPGKIPLIDYGGKVAVKIKGASIFKTKVFKDAAQQVIEYMLDHKIDMYRVFIDDHQYRIELKRSPIDKPNGTYIDRTKITGECTFD